MVWFGVWFGAWYGEIIGNGVNAGETIGMTLSGPQVPQVLKYIINNNYSIVAVMPD